MPSPDTWTPSRGGAGTALGAAVIALSLAFLATACGSGGPEPTPLPVFQGQAVQIFLREAYKTGWFREGDPVQITSEPMLWADALAKAEELGLSLYPTLPGTPPYQDGLPGWLMTAQGDFYASAADNATPGPDTPRRPAIAVAFVDRQGRITYSLRFLDASPTPASPTP